MKSINFPGAYLKIGAGQEEYYTIHAMPVDGPEGEVIAAFELTEEEVSQIVESKTLFYSRLTFGNVCKCKHCGQQTPTGFQPMKISAEPMPIKVNLLYEDGTTIQLDGQVRKDGVYIPGYTRNEQGKYTKNDDANL